uniref:Uncharacterized protein n=1 Tax=Cajanus cajan TaxID=3821 RepID=A0A151SGS6_CAJCA|nr:hypothetical protein KK1_000196 [Cajanus cajan]
MGKSYQSYYNPKEHGNEEKKEGTEKKQERMPTEDINASADAFIKNFRHHLLLQRLQSIESHKKREH